MGPRFIEIELTETWMGHPPGTVHRLGTRMANILIGRKTAKPKKQDDQENEEKMETGKLDKMVRRSVRK